jgi:hypothetical protein
MYRDVNAHWCTEHNWHCGHERNAIEQTEEGVVIGFDNFQQFKLWKKVISQLWGLKRVGGQKIIRETEMFAMLLEPSHIISAM